MTITFNDDSIIIDNHFLTEEKIREIAYEINNDMKIKKVIFKNVEFSEFSINEFSTALNFNTRENEKVMFEFNDTPLSTNDVFSLNKHFKHFTKLHFRNTSLNDESIKIIAKFIESDPKNITTVHLEKNRFGVEGHHALINALCKNTNIDKLFLKNTHDFKNRQDFTPVYYHIAHLLEANSTLKVIGLQEAGVNYPLIDILTEGLSKNRGLHRFDLGNKVYERDITGTSTQKIATAIAKQGIINQFNEKITTASKNRSFPEIKKIVNQHKKSRDDLFGAISRCDINQLNTWLSKNKFNLHWTKDNTYYNALHVLALSKSPINTVKKVIEILYKNNFKILLNKRSGRNSGSFQPMELAKRAGRQDIADAMNDTWGEKPKPQITEVSKKQPSKDFANNYKACGLFSKSLDLNDDKEFPKLVSSLKG